MLVNGRGHVPLCRTVFSVGVVSQTLVFRANVIRGGQIQSKDRKLKFHIFCTDLIQMFLKKSATGIISKDLF